MPGSWNEQYEDIYNYLGLAWYLKSAYIPPYWQGQRVFLRVGSACYFGTVYINGVKIGSHEGRHLPFAFEITDHIHWEAENIIVISVENELKPTRVPSGNMGTPLLPVASYPHTTYDFFPFAGIHRPVVLFSVPQTYIEDVTVVTDIDGLDGILKVVIRLNAAVSSQGDLQLKGDDTTVTAKLDFLDGVAEAQLIVANAKFWSDKTPYLYNLVIQTEQDSDTLKVGIRTIRVQDNQILLNGKPVKLNGFDRHEDFIASGKGLNLSLLVKDYQLMRWTGANSYRTSHYPYNEEEMQLADGNADGKVDAGDTQFADLKVWRDFNQDGLTQNGELFTLAELGIAAINTGNIEQNRTLPNGNQIADLGIYTKTDGSSGTTGEVIGNLADINLAANPFNREFTDPLDTTAVNHLPDMQGSGMVRDLREAANDCLWRVAA